MDSSFKALIHIWLVFFGIVLLLSCLSFFIAYNHATSVLYSAIQDVEIYGYDNERIKRIEDNTNTTILVNQQEVKYGQQYELKVIFHHVFAFINKDKVFYVSGLTRMFEY